MNTHTSEKRKGSFARALRKDLAFVTILSLLFWVTGAPGFTEAVHAAQVTNFSDTISDSNLGAGATHVLAFNATNGASPGETFAITLDPTVSTPGTNAFSETYAAATSTQMTFVAGATTYSVVSACTTGNQVTASDNGTYNSGSNETLTFTVCSGAASIASSTAMTITVGTSTPVWYNPSTAGSYVIRLSGTSGNTGDTRVVTLQNVTVTASVDTTFTFTVSGLATSSFSALGDVNTTGSTTATALAFNTLIPNATSTLGQQLNVATNARNGFAVTVQENQPLTSATGAIINLFQDGATTSSPTAWTAPSNTLNQPNTYSHFGVTSDDADEGGGEFVGAKYAGNIDVPRQIFSNSGPSDGTTQNIGKARVFYTAEVESLQPAGNDYTNILTYVATPTF